jgi:triosephosphate isomerase
VGETFEERQEGSKDFVIINQVTKAVAGVKLTKANQLIVAYEPVWVIGSGQAVAPEEVEHTHRVIKQVLVDNFELDTINKRIRLIYGGSVEPDNIKGFFALPSIDGALVGGASLEPIIFNDLIKEVS